MSSASPSGTQDITTPGWPTDAVEVGRILGAWGVKGWIKVQPFAADAQTLLGTRRWLVQPPEGQPNALPRSAGALQPSFPSELQVAQAREHGGLLVAQVLDVADRAQAEKLRGVRVFAPRAQFPKPKAGEYYWVDLIGLDVINREGQAMGTVVGLIDTGPHSVLRLSRPLSEAAVDDVQERLIPFVAAYVDDVDLPARRITVDWGLDY